MIKRQAVVTAAAGTSPMRTGFSRSSSTARHLRHISAAAFTHTAGELRTYASGTNTVVAGDVDSDGRGDFQIVLIGSHTLGSSDFVL